MTDYADLIALAKRQTHVGPLQSAHATGEAHNASCGDVCTVWISVLDGKITNMAYEAKGCVISRAAAAVLAEAAMGPIGPIGPMSGSHIRALLGADISPLRERCLTTALVALQNAIHSYDVSH